MTTAAETAQELGTTILDLRNRLGRTFDELAHVAAGAISTYQNVHAGRRPTLHHAAQEAVEIAQAILAAAEPHTTPVYFYAVSTQFSTPHRFDNEADLAEWCTEYNGRQVPASRVDLRIWEG